MENGSLDRYGPVKTALKEVGFKVDKVEKQDKKRLLLFPVAGNPAMSIKTKPRQFPRNKGKMDYKV